MNHPEILQIAKNAISIEIKELENLKKGGIEIVERYLTNDNNEPYSSIDVKIDD